METPATYQSNTATKVFTVLETRHLLKILMNPKTLSMFKDNKQSHAFVWNYVFKCMKIKFPKFAKSTRQCYKKYENLKGKYYEIKRAQINGEQRPYWLYYNEMDYIISHFPGHKPRLSIDSAAATNSGHNSTITSLDGTTSNSNVTNNHSEMTDVKGLRSAPVSTSILEPSGDSNQSPNLPKKLQLLIIIKNTKSTEFIKKSEGWELALRKAQSKGLFPLNKTWVDFYYEVWITHLDDTIAKWESFANGTKVVRYDEADKIMFDIIKDDWNDFGNNSTSTIRIPTLRTLPGFIEKLKDLKSHSIVSDEIDNIFSETTESETPNDPYFVSTNSNSRLENGENSFQDPNTSPIAPNDNDRQQQSLTPYKQQALQLKNQFIKTKMSAYVEKHNRKCYKMDLELYKIEKELGLPPSEFTQKFIQPIVTTHTTPSSHMTSLPHIPSMHLHPHQQQHQQQHQQPIINNAGPQIQTVNGGNANSGPVHPHINESFFNVDIKREINFDDGGNFDFV